MTGRNAFLCTALNCDEYELSIFDYADPEWDEVFDWIENNYDFDLDINAVIMGLIMTGLGRIDEAIEATIDAEENNDIKRDLLKLNTYYDFERVIDGTSTILRCVNNAVTYLLYFDKTLKDFQRWSGFEIEF